MAIRPIAGAQGPAPQEWIREAAMTSPSAIPPDDPNRRLTGAEPDGAARAQWPSLSRLEAAAGYDRHREGRGDSGARRIGRNGGHGFRRRGDEREAPGGTVASGDVGIALLTPGAAGHSEAGIQKRGCRLRRVEGTRRGRPGAPFHAK